MKQQFRAAAPGNHEWIPSDQILAVVLRTTEETEVQDQAVWVKLQHELRTPTEAIIFKPEPKLDLMDGWDGTPEEFVESPPPLVASCFGLQGHSGALYLPDGKGKAVQQTRGQSEWHDQLRATFLSNDEPAKYLDALTTVIESTLWNGGLDFLPPELRPAAHLISVNYTGKKNVDLGVELEEMAGQVTDSIRKIRALIEDARAQVS